MQTVDSFLKKILKEKQVKLQTVSVFSLLFAFYSFCKAFRYSSN